MYSWKSHGVTSCRFSEGFLQKYVVLYGDISHHCSVFGMDFSFSVLKQVNEESCLDDTKLFAFPFFFFFYFRGFAGSRIRSSYLVLQALVMIIKLLKAQPLQSGWSLGVMERGSAILSCYLSSFHCASKHDCRAVQSARLENWSSFPQTLHNIASFSVVSMSSSSSLFWLSVPTLKQWASSHV